MPYPSLSGAFDNRGISDDSNRSAGNLDGGGSSHSNSAQALAAEGLSPGATVTHDGLTFSCRTLPRGSADNVLASGR